MYIEATRPISTLSRLQAGIRELPGVESLYRGFHARVLVLQRPRRLTAR
jgi:hypothetical protein